MTNQPDLPVPPQHRPGVSRIDVADLESVVPATTEPWPTCPECQQALEVDVIDVTTEPFAAEHGRSDLRPGLARCVTPGCPRA